MIDTKVKPKEAYIYHHKDYPKWVEHPYAELDSKNKPVLCADADAELEFLYSFTEEGRLKLAGDKEKAAEALKAEEEKVLKVEQMRKKAYENAVKQAKSQVVKARLAATKSEKQKVDPKENIFG